jgi:hypothetical protein
MHLQLPTLQKLRSHHGEKSALRDLVRAGERLIRSPSAAGLGSNVTFLPDQLYGIPTKPGPQLKN